MMMAIAATRGQATLSNVRTEHLHAIIAKLQETGVRIHEVSSDAIKVDARGKLYPENLVCDVYPQVATDVQAPFGAFLATIKGHSRVEDRVYPDRFTHVEELQRMGVDARLNDDVLYIYGGSLEGAQVHAADIRAGGALIVAALAASGTSIITGVNFIERGYEDITERLRGLGANIHKGNLDVLATGTFGS
jgi:UDP-N-acetylglucosamine 1-carboxyvinyltransferase